MVQTFNSLAWIWDNPKGPSQLQSSLCYWLKPLLLLLLQFTSSLSQLHLPYSSRRCSPITFPEISCGQNFILESVSREPYLRQELWVKANWKKHVNNLVNFMVLWNLQEPGGYMDLKLLNVILAGGISGRQRPRDGNWSHSKKRRSPSASV